MNRSRRFLFPAIVLCLAAPLSTARAERVLHHYNLDSLVYLSEAVVRVEVGAAQEFKTADGTCQVHTVKALDVFKGAIKPGDSFRVTGLDTFHRAPGIAGTANSWDPIQPGNTVYLFLVTNGKMGYAMYSLTNADWTIIESGARLLEGDKVYGFGQYSLHAFGAALDPAPIDLANLSATRPTATRRQNMQPTPSGFVAMTPATYVNAPVLAREDFESRLREALKNAPQITAMLNAAVTPEQLAADVKFLQSRPAVVKAEMGRDDYLGEMIVQKIGPVAPPELLEQLRQDAPESTRWQLDMVLREGRSRSYLLQRVADTKETMEHRVELARILADAGSAYSRDDRKEADFPAKLAQLAVANLGTNLSEPLLRGVANCARGPFGIQRELPTELQPAANILSDAFPKATALEQFHIAETLMQMGDGPYHKLLPDAGPLLTLIEPDADFAAALAKRELRFTARFRSQIAVATDLLLILRPVAGDNDIEIPADSELVRHTNTFGSGFRFQVGIADIPAGKYHAFLRDVYYAFSRRSGDGLGFDVEVPAK